MNRDNSENHSTSISDDVKNQSFKQNLSKFEYELYREEDDKAEKVIRVKRIGMPNKVGKWKVFENSQVVFIIEGAKLAKKEREFLGTIEGFNFLLAQAKVGIKSLNKLRAELKKTMALKAAKSK